MFVVSASVSRMPSGSSAASSLAMVDAGMSHHPAGRSGNSTGPSGPGLGTPVSLSEDFGAGGWVAIWGSALGVPPPRVATTRAVTAAAAATPAPPVEDAPAAPQPAAVGQRGRGQAVGGGQVVHRVVEALAQVGAVVEIGHEVLPL